MKGSPIVWEGRRASVRRSPKVWKLPAEEVTRALGGRARGHNESTYVCFPFLASRLQARKTDQRLSSCSLGRFPAQRDTAKFVTASLRGRRPEGKRARELFEALDDDGNGTLDEEEFVQVDQIFCWVHFEFQCDKAL